MIALVFLASCVPPPAPKTVFQRAQRAYARGDYVGAFKYFSLSADDEHPVGQYMLAELYAHGEGVEQDLYKARVLYVKAAKAGITNAQYTLGLMYRYGSGTLQNLRQATYWLTKAAYHGHHGAQMAVANLLDSHASPRIDLIKAYMWYSLIMQYKYTDFRNVAAQKREKLEKLLTPQEVAIGERRAQMWRPVTMQ